MKSILKQQGMKLLSCSIVIVTIGLVITSCKKQAQFDSSSAVENKSTDLIKTAQNYFTTSVINTKTEKRALPLKSLPKNAEPRQSVQIEKLSKLIKWETAVTYNTNGISYVIVPVNGPRKPFKNKEFEFFRSLIFHTTQADDMDMAIVEVLGKKGYFLGNNLQEIANVSFVNKAFSKSISIGDINAYVIFYDKNYLQETSVQLTNGKWSDARISFRSDLEITL